MPLPQEYEEVLNSLLAKGHAKIKELQIIDKPFDENNLPDNKPVDRLLHEPENIDYTNLTAEQKDYLFKRSNMGQYGVNARVKKGWSMEDAIMIPKGGCRPIASSKPVMIEKLPEYNLQQLSIKTDIPTECIKEFVSDWLFPEPSTTDPMVWKKDKFKDIQKFVKTYLKRVVEL